MFKARYQSQCDSEGRMTQNLDELNVDTAQFAQEIATEIDEQLVQDLQRMPHLFRNRFSMKNYLFQSDEPSEPDEWLEPG